MHHLLLMLWCVLCITTTASYKENGPKLPTPFPESFSISFVTNITADGQGVPIDGKLYYDWSIQSQRIDHAAGSYECRHFYNTTESCTLVFLPRGGMYRILQGEPQCCLDLAGVGAPPPDWAMRANPTYNGVLWDDYSGSHAHQWTFDHLKLLSLNGDFHTTRQVASGKHAGTPLLFSFPGKAEGRQDYHYSVDSFAVSKQNATLFQLPDGCADVQCPSSIEGEERFQIMEER